MTVGELRAALSNPLIEDRHEVWIGNRGCCAKCAIAETAIDTKPEMARVFLVIPAEGGDYVVGHRGEVDEDEFMEDEP